ALAAVSFAGVVVGDVQPPGEAHAVVHHQDLAVIAAEEAGESRAEGAPGEANRIVVEDADAGSLKAPHEAPGQGRAPDVDDHVDLHARPRALGESAREATAGPVGAEDVGLQADMRSRGGDRLQHGRVGLLAVAEEGEAMLSDPEGGVGLDATGPSGGHRFLAAASTRRLPSGRARKRSARSPRSPPSPGPQEKATRSTRPRMAST